MNSANQSTFRFHSNGEQFWVTSTAENGSTMIVISKTPLTNLSLGYQEKMRTVLSAKEVLALTGASSL